MNITQLTTALPFLKQSGLVPNIIGKHGIGKSSVVAQFAAENGYGFYPFFLGQMSDVGDILGLPEFNRDSSGNATSVSFVHPAKLPKKKGSILFFDELNRASKDLLQAIFQLALEGTLHDYKLPEDSFIIMAMNPATDDYSVLDFADKAFADRFVHINLDPTHEEFHTYMRKRYGNSTVSDFLQQQTKLLEESDLKAVTLDFVKPSRRSWDRLQKLENTGLPEALFRECGMGIVGAPAMIAYASWKETQVKVVDGKEILDNYKKVQDRFKGYFQNVKTGEPLENPRTDIVTTVTASLVEELTLRLKERAEAKKELTKKEVTNALDFLLDAPIENAYAALLNLKNVPEFALDKTMKEQLHENKELITKIREARVAKTKYKAEKGETLSDDEKALINA
jgi:HD superfamily phosphohydrolase